MIVCVGVLVVGCRFVRGFLGVVFVVIVAYWCFLVLGLWGFAVGVWFGLQLCWF